MDFRVQAVQDYVQSAAVFAMVAVMLGKHVEEVKNKWCLPEQVVHFARCIACFLTHIP